MKRIIFNVLIIAVIMTGFIFPENSIAASNYSNDFDGVLNELKYAAAATNVVATFNRLIWKDVGPSKIVNYIDVFVEFSKAGGAANPSDLNVWTQVGHDSNTGITGVAVWFDINVSFRVAGLNPDEAISAYCQGYSYISDMSDLKESIKTFRKNYPDKTDAINAFQDYFVTISEYADLAMNIKGSYNSYSDSIDKYQKEINRKKIYAEFTK